MTSAESKTGIGRAAWRRIVRFGFRLLYQEMAWTYDAVSWLVSLGEWRAWQQSALPYVCGRRVLEVGHGPGHMLVALAARGKQTVGLDFSPQMGRLARRNTQKSGVSVLLVRGKVQDLPLATAVFDTVLSTFPTDYIVDPATLLSVHRVLAENGRLIIVPEGHLTGEGLIYRFIDWLFRITGQRDGPFALDRQQFWPDHQLWQHLRQRFDTAGFDVQIEHVRRPRSAVTVIVAHKL